MPMRPPRATSTSSTALPATGRKRDPRMTMLLCGLVSLTPHQANSTSSGTRSVSPNCSSTMRSTQVSGRLWIGKVVDGYVVVAEGVAQDISEVEIAVFAPGRADLSEVIYKLKRENLEIRRAVAPLYTAADLLVSRRWRSWGRCAAPSGARSRDPAGSRRSLLQHLLPGVPSRSVREPPDTRRMAGTIQSVATSSGWLLRRSRRQQQHL